MVQTGLLRPRRFLPWRSLLVNSNPNVAGVALRVLSFIGVVEELLDDELLLSCFLESATSHQVGLFPSFVISFFPQVMLILLLLLLVLSVGSGIALKPAKRDGRPTDDIP